MTERRMVRDVIEATVTGLATLLTIFGGCYLIFSLAGWIAVQHFLQEFEQNIGGLSMKAESGTKPGDYIDAYLERRGKTQRWLAAATEYSPASINHAIKGRKKIDVALAEKLAEQLGEDPDYWLNIQRDSDRGVLTPPTPIPLSLDVSFPEISASGLQVNTQILHLMKHGELMIEGFEPSLLDTSYYFPNAEYIKTAEKSVEQLPSPLELPDRSRVRLQSSEHFHFPNYIYGTIELSGPLAEEGLIMTTPKTLRAGFEGYIVVTVMNITGEDLTFDKVYKFVNLQFHRLSNPADEISH